MQVREDTPQISPELRVWMLESCLKRAEQKNEDYAQSTSFRLGLLINRALLRPGLHTLRFPVDVVRLFRGTLPPEEEETVEYESRYLPIASTEYSLNRVIRTDNGECRPLTIACILDSLSLESFSYEANLLLPVPNETWKALFAQHHPDLFFVESFWEGNEGAWGSCALPSSAFQYLFDILAYCHEHAIPTVFWNKEDPVSYERFALVADCFDYVFTSDELSVPRYREDYDRIAEVLSFAVSPAIHNPIPRGERRDRAVFAGTYFKKYPQRCIDFDRICDAFERLSIPYDIFDRRADTAAESREDMMYPRRYSARIKGSLPPSEMWRVNKGYKYQINVNSVQHSPTMFARRVYEALASGSLVVSNPSVGVEEAFGDVVVIIDQSDSGIDRLRSIQENDEAYRSTIIAGVRQVFDNHTYAHRLQQVCDAVGINTRIEYHPIRIHIVDGDADDLTELARLVSRQTYPCFEAVVEDQEHELEETIFCGESRSLRVSNAQGIDGITVTTKQLDDERFVSDYAYGLNNWT